jgi:hypothetical protein
MNTSKIQLEQIAIHDIGNKSRDEGIKLSAGIVSFIYPETKKFLLKYFLSSFNENEVYNFTHPSELSLNEIYVFVSKIFAARESFFDVSLDMARHLYENSVHPRVGAGELSICHFRDVPFEDKEYEAIGIFKTEEKDVFLKFEQGKGNYRINHDDGININKLDKGCLILNVEKSNGYKVFIVDSNRANDTQYWKNDFLNIKPASDDYHFTKDFLSITKSFVTGQFPNEFEVSKADQIDMLNRSVDFFKTRESFDKKEFEAEVLREPGIIKSFHDFDNNYRQENKIEIDDDFAISPHAVKKQAKVFKSVLKLDNNFHIYIHGNKNMIEQGVEHDGRKFYKIYFDQES